MRSYRPLAHGARTIKNDVKTRARLARGWFAMARRQAVVSQSEIERAIRVRPDPICYPPRGLSREEAARYVGVGTTKFDEMVTDGRMPRPKRIDGRLVWDRLKLDAAFSDLPDDDRANPLDRMLRVV